MWILIAGGMGMLLLAAISKRNHGACSGYTITIQGVEKNYFLDEKDVDGLLQQAAGRAVTGATVETIDLHKLEQKLKANPWVKEAQLYFDNKNWLHVSITEKEPVARVFTQNGSSFYIDAEAKRLPLSEKLSANVPVFTGFTDRKSLTAADSSVLLDIEKTGSFIMNDSFWSAQVAQIDLDPLYGMEMIPVVGNQVIRLGTAENIESKFHKLMLFYRQVLAKTGLNKYRLIDLRFRGQIVASKEGDAGAMDSVQLRRNVEALLRDANSVPDDSDQHTETLQPTYQLQADSADQSADGLPDAKPEAVQHDAPVESPKPVVNQAAAPKPVNPKPVAPKPVTPVPVKQDPPKPAKHTNPKPDDKPKKPRAVMQPRQTENNDRGY